MFPMFPMFPQVRGLGVVFWEHVPVFPGSVFRVLWLCSCFLGVVSTFVLIGCVHEKVAVTNIWCDAVAATRRDEMKGLVEGNLLFCCALVVSWGEVHAGAWLFVYFGFAPAVQCLDALLDGFFVG